MKSKRALDLLIKDTGEYIAAKKVYLIVETAELEAEKRSREYTQREDRERARNAYCNKCKGTAPHNCNGSIKANCGLLYEFMKVYDNEPY